MTRSGRQLASHCDIEVSPLVLGTNVFGWTADVDAAHAVLDAYVSAGGNMIDTADAYPAWAQGRIGGESELVIGEWLRGRQHRDELTIATKVSRHPYFKGLAPSNIRSAVDASLSRLGVDHIDLYYAHFDDADTPLIESIDALSRLVDQGKVRYLGISNYSLDRIEQWLALTNEHGFHRPVALQQQFSLMERQVEHTTLPLAQQEGIGFLPYYVLARGFLTGKYRPATTVDTPRFEDASTYLTDRGLRVLAALDRVAANHGMPVAAVTLAWTAAQAGVVAPIASARNREQLAALLTYPRITLTAPELQLLSEAAADR